MDISQRPFFLVSLLFSFTPRRFRFFCHLLLFCCHLFLFNFFLRLSLSSQISDFSWLTLSNTFSVPMALPPVFSLSFLYSCVSIFLIRAFHWFDKIAYRIKRPLWVEPLYFFKPEKKNGCHDDFGQFKSKFSPLFFKSNMSSEKNYRPVIKGALITRAWCNDPLPSPGALGTENTVSTFGLFLPFIQWRCVLYIRLATAGPLLRC